MTKHEKNDTRRTLHNNAIDLMRRVLALHGTFYRGCGFHWALERGAGGLLNKVCDYDSPFTELSLDNLQGAYKDLLKRVEAAEKSQNELAPDAALQEAHKSLLEGRIEHDKARDR